MKKLIFAATIALVGAIMFTSCGKRCYCTRYENGTKMMVTENDRGARYFDKDACINQSVPTYRGYSIQDYEKEVDVEIKCN